jgi:hypothetical protein
MTIPRSLALALIAGTGIVGAFIGRALPRDAPSTQAISSGSPAPSATPPAGDDCKAERAELASTKVELAICMAFDTRTPKTAPSDVPEVPKPDLPERESPEVRRNRELLEDDSEAVIVRRADGTIGIYKADELPSGFDGLIIGRKSPDGKLGWYSKPVAGSRSDPAADGQPDPPMFRGTSIKLEPDGRLTVRGKPAPPWVERMLGGKAEDPAKP